MKIVTSLSFQGQCREAFDFYARVLGGKITAANDVQQPADSIGANAIPQLNQEVLTAQSANIQAVSGATFTSDGYIKSLQQAVDQAGLLSSGGTPPYPRCPLGRR